MASEPVWEVRWLHFNDGIGFEHVNAELARVAQGWEPFATLEHRSGGWALLLKRECASGD